MIIRLTEAETKRLLHAGLGATSCPVALRANGMQILSIAVWDKGPPVQLELEIVDQDPDEGEATYED